MTTEEIAELIKLYERSREDLRWEAGNVASRDYFSALKKAAPALLRAAKIAARVPEKCCYTCNFWGDCSPENDPLANDVCDMWGKTLLQKCRRTVTGRLSDLFRMS